MPPLFAIDLRTKQYRWVIVFAGFLGLLAALGIGRFSLGMLLPSMGSGLDLSYADMGMISTANFCGYLGAVVFSGWLSSLLGPRALIFLALLLVSSSMTLVGTSSHLVVITLFYFLTGVGSACANIPIMALISRWFPPEQRGQAAGFCIMGNGLGILLSARLVPILAENGGSWRQGWWVLGGAVLMIAFTCLLLIRNSPDREEKKQSTFSKPAFSLQLPSLSRWQRRSILLSGMIYLLFGLSYVIYITFLVTSLVQDRGLSEQEAGTIWAWVGILSLFSGPVFGALSDRYGRKRILIIVFAMQAAAYLLAASSLPLTAIYLSVALYGIVAFSVPTIIAAQVGDCTPAQTTAVIFGWVTFAFGIGQIVGPAIAGLIAENKGDFSLSFTLAALFALCALFTTAFLPAKNNQGEE